MEMVPNRECPECVKQGHDSKGDHLFLMSDGKTWCCTKGEYHASGENYLEHTDGTPKKKSKEETYEGSIKLSEILSQSKLAQGKPKESNSSTTGFEPTIPVSTPPATGVRPVDVEYRSIAISTFAKFNSVGAYDATGELEGIGYDLIETDSKRIITQKWRKFPKDFYCAGKTGKGTKIQLFGQDIFPSGRKLLITEGELDAMSAWQMMQTSKYTKNVSVVSLPLGANLKPLLDNASYLARFKEIIVCADQDTAGKKVSRDIANAIPQAKFMKMDEKDANDMLTKGKAKDFESAFFAAAIYKPDSIIFVEDVMDKVLLKPTMGEPWPWPTLTKKTYGRNKGQGIYVGAGVKIGKSEFINEIVAFDVSRKRKIAVLKYEEPPFMTVKRVAGKLDGIFYHRPGVSYSDADLKAAALSMQDYLIMYPAFGQATWESTKEFIRYAAISGCETIIIDPITKLTNHLNSSETENELRTLSDELACMAQDMGFFYIVTCHLKAPTNGKPHERGGKVQSYQFRGSRAMMENTYYMMGIERNKDPDLTEDEINTSTFVLLEDRNFGNTAKFQVFYDNTNQSYLEPTGGIF